ncbi:hypothetical protein FHU41_000207 [Psychromicrobium silvestre]|uniref:GyrI-like small molecule binding domain-containing protein n=1 Tax=Psychromicrobium silvestre TaxID=1645614 RepID=A0A7Y9LQZ9_9MICC|nr:GyrI-like domain-containing protein [Psychromicrobium silvestre]NYE93986.1 hypothetical protein [Psychromicrobium silvestre]
MDKYDLKKDLKNLYSTSAKDFQLVEVPELGFLMVDGEGDPNTSADYLSAVEALFSIAYTLKFSSKAAGRDFVVTPLEGLWRAADPSAFTSRDKDSWLWTMMIAQPEWVTEEAVRQAVQQAAAKKGLSPQASAALERLRYRRYTEGLSVQILHLGSYDDEAPTLSRLHHEYLPTQGLDFNGDHHEIYLSDARRTAPEKLKTILRQPVKTVSKT